MRVEVQNTQAVADALRKYGKDAEREIGRAIDKMGLAVTSDVKRKIQRGPKTGKIYKRKNKDHQSSRGINDMSEAPATDTGLLVSAGQFYTNKINPMTIEIGSRSAYAGYLEFGTKKMTKRPAWIPSIEQNRAKFNDWIEDALRKAAR